MFAHFLSSTVISGAYKSVCEGVGYIFGPPWEHNTPTFKTPLLKNVDTFFNCVKVQFDHKHTSILQVLKMLCNFLKWTHQSPPKP